jgi:hypothetical protein
MPESLPREELASHGEHALPSSPLEALLDEVRDMPCGRLFNLVARQIASLDPEVQADVRPLGVLFRYRERGLCELSLFGELFLARLGPGQAVEVRVRNPELALLVLDQVLRHFLRDQRGGTAVSPP